MAKHQTSDKIDTAKLSALLVEYTDKLKAQLARATAAASGEREECHEVYNLWLALEPPLRMLDDLVVEAVQAHEFGLVSTEIALRQAEFTYHLDAVQKVAKKIYHMPK